MARAEYTATAATLIRAHIAGLDDASARARQVCSDGPAQIFELEQLARRDHGYCANRLRCTCPGRSQPEN